MTTPDPWTRTRADALLVLDLHHQLRRQLPLADAALALLDTADRLRRTPGEVRYMLLLVEDERFEPLAQDNIRSVIADVVADYPCLQPVTSDRSTP